jgi:hypothetical protein
MTENPPTHWLPLFDGDDPGARFTGLFTFSVEHAMARTRAWLLKKDSEAIVETCRLVDMAALAEAKIKVPIELKKFDQAYVATIVQT